jgi:hypothetical protein
MFLNSLKKTAVLGFLIFLLCVIPLFSEESLLSDESAPVLSAVLFVSDDILPSDVPLSDAETFISEAPLPSEEFFLYDEESLLSDESYLYEAPSLIFEVPKFIFEPRSFNDIFPGFSQRQKAYAFSSQGLKHYFEKDGDPTLIPNPDSGIDLLSSVMAKKPSHIIEALVLVPYNERELDMLDIYNALGRIEKIKDYSVPISRDKDINIFTETTRLENARNRKSISDPPPANMLPYSETMYLRFKDAYYGNLFIRGDVSMSLYGITYSMTNFTDIRYLLFPIIKTERISINIYLEPVAEGILVYSMSGLYLPDFIASKVNLAPNINIRVSTLINWITDGLKKQETMAANLFFGH